MRVGTIDNDFCEKVIFPPDKGGLRGGLIFLRQDELVATNF